MNRTTTFRLATSLLIVHALCGGARAGSAKAEARFKNLPQGWSLSASVVVPDAQLPAFSKKLAGDVVRISNSLLVVEGQQLQVNIVECRTDDDAAKVHETLVRLKGSREACPREGKSVIELRCKDLRLIERAYHELGFTAPKVTYHVAFEAAPIEKCDYMLWNRMFNAFLLGNEAAIRELSRSFTFSEQISLRSHGLGSEKSLISFTPRARAATPLAGADLTTYSFAGLPRKHGVPAVAVELTVTCQAFALTPTTRKAGPELLAATEFWPTTDPEIVALARKITKGNADLRAKTAALLEWTAAPANIKYGGPITGSRYGVKKVLAQGFGRCWDSADCFVTLCRAADVPCRQVLGWLDASEGHVWAEVLVGGAWRQVDPTSGRGCDCRYIPYIASEDGRAPFVYVSAVKAKLKGD